MCMMCTAAGPVNSIEYSPGLLIRKEGRCDESIVSLLTMYGRETWTWTVGVDVV